MFFCILLLSQRLDSAKRNRSQAVNTNVTERNLDRIDNKLNGTTLFTRVCVARVQSNQELLKT